MQFSESQIKAIKHVDGPCLVLAVPGAGKTTILIQRIINLVKIHSVLPSQILALTFTRASANDMKRRIEELGDDIKVQNIKTIHSLCYDIVALKCEKENKRFRMIEDRRLGSLRFDILNHTKMRLENIPLTIEEYRNLLSAISNMKTLGSPTSSEDRSMILNNFEEYYNDYENYKNKNDLYDFDDLLIVADKLLKEDVEIRNYYKNKFKYISLDEAQDTSIIQWSIIKSLLTAKENLFAVADDDQSIYRFRGANPEMLMRFGEEFKNAKIIYLETNYRSRFEIVNSASKLIKNNNIRYKKNICADKDKSSTVKVRIMKSRKSQYSNIIKTIKDTNGEVALIYRNNLSAVALMDALDRELISFELKDHNIDFFNQVVYKDITDILKFFNNPSDIESYSNVYFKLKGYISRKEINSIKHSLGETYFEKIYNNFDVPSYKKELIEELEYSRRALIKNFSKNGLDILLNHCGYLDYLNHFKRLNNRGLEGYMRHFRTLRIISNGCNDIEEFLNRLEDIKNMALRESRSEIKLMSMHASKGLEFDTVILLDLLNSEIPGEHITKNELEEERRLLYVGMTRAKENLFMYAYKNDGNQEFKISRFLDELKSGK